MKKILSITILALILLASCQKGGEQLRSSDGETPITFGVTMPDLDVQTKVDAVTALPTMQVSATLGTGASQTKRWTNITFTKDGSGIYHADKWWPNSDEQYNFYASNNDITFVAAGSTVAAVNTKDVVCAYLAYTNGSASGTSKYRVKNDLTFEHIFARIGNFRVYAQDQYEIKNVTIQIRPYVSGTYDMKAGKNITNNRTGWSSLTQGDWTTIFSASGDSQKIASTAYRDTANDLYLAPGEYTLRASWTASRGWNSETSAYDYVHTYSNVETTITVNSGAINTIQATLSGYATEITFGVTINAWTNPAATGVTFNHVY